MQIDASYKAKEDLHSMKHYFFAVIAVLAIVGLGQGTVGAEVIPLHALDLGRVASIARAPRFSDQPRASGNHVTAGSRQKSGDAPRLAACPTPLVNYRMALRLVQYHVGQKGECVETVVTAPAITTVDGCAATTTVLFSPGGYSIQATPCKVNDKTVKMTAEVKALGEKGETVCFGKNMRTIKLGQTIRIVGMTEAPDKRIRNVAQQGAIVRNAGEYTGYYLDAKVTVQAPAPHEK